MEESMDNELNENTLVHATFSLPLSFRCEQRILRLVSECKTRKFVKDTDIKKKCKLVIMEIWTEKRHAKGIIASLHKDLLTGKN